jgi:hypothetical protein
VIFELLSSTAAFAIPINVSIQSGVNQKIVPEINAWNQKFLDTLGKMWGVYPVKPIDMIVTYANFGPEMGFTSPQPNSFEVMVNLRYPLPETKGIVAHELMHVFQFTWMNKYNKTMPLWVMEGLATWFGGKEGIYPSSIGYDPFLFQSVDPLKYENYPLNDDRLGEYYAEVYALFNAIDKKVNLQKSLPTVIQSVKDGSTWNEAFSAILNENFDTFYSNWRKTTFDYSLMGLIGIWGLWMLLPAFLFLIFLINVFRIRKVSFEGEENIEALEALYGKEYWKDGEEDEKVNGNSGSK